MKIIQTIKGADENIVVYEDNGIKTTVKRPRIVSIDMIIDEIRELCDKKPKGIDLNVKHKRPNKAHYE